MEKTLKSPLDCKEIQPVHSKGNQSWVFIGRTDAKAETPVLWPPHAKNWLIGKDSDAGRDWGEGEGDGRGWDGWMASPTRWTWVWVNSGSWWWTERPGVLRFMGSQRVGHDWAIELNWTEWLMMLSILFCIYWLFVYLLWKDIYSDPLAIFSCCSIFIDSLKHRKSKWLTQQYSVDGKDKT